MRDILIVGAGQAGLQLGLGLNAEGHRVTIVSARRPEEIRDGWPTSTQALFEPALAAERAHGLNHWEQDSPAIAGLHVALAAPPGNLALRFKAPLERPARSTDQRIKMSRWLTDAAERGIEVIYREVGLGDLGALAREHELTVVAAGRGELTAAFARDEQRSPFTEPQRALAVAYVHGLAPDPAWPEPHVGFNAVPGLGELFVIPALAADGPCDILFWEAVPGGPLDVFAGRLDPAEHLEITLRLIKENLPWVHERCAGVRLAGERATLHGRFTPTVRRPVAQLPGGAIALGIGDVVIANDPITGQGANTAAKAADHYLRAVVSRGDQPFDERWMTETFESFWAEHGRAVTGWTDAMLQPLPPHVQQLLGAAAGNEVIARRFAAGFDDPNDLGDWFMDPEKAAGYLAAV
ncbi:styrene monooxygenase/indole monooxygenase family protein [Actinoplanes sp. NPDC024001]|uniref:styrene monooxygenase/indole monooxygenase family protein n=1 Tax=Actinoplanes sp. NPDC024001 TaxID=3154598 RepID=UPI0034062BEC